MFRPKSFIYSKLHIIIIIIIIIVIIIIIIIIINFLDAALILQ